MGGGCGGSMEGGEEAAAPRRGTWPDGGKVTARYSFSPLSITPAIKERSKRPTRVCQGAGGPTLW